MEVTPFNFISIIALVLALGAIGGVFLQDDRTVGIVEDETENLRQAVDGLLESQVTETKVKSWVNSANTVLVDKVKALEDADPPTAGISESRVNQLIDNKVLVQYDIDGSIKSLKDKDTALQKEIDDLEDDNNRGSSSSGGDEDTTMDSVSKFYDRGDTITFSGRTEPRDTVELFISYEGERFKSTDLDDRADANGIWIITCRNECTEERGDYEAYVENVDNGDRSNEREYEVD